MPAARVVVVTGLPGTGVQSSRLSDASFAPGCDSFLDLPSVQYVRDGASHHTVPGDLDNWMNLRAASL
ncbi:MAG: hypothetical protein WDO56_01310 [Gammaproteobacteria bacterium]